MRREERPAAYVPPPEMATWAWAFARERADLPMRNPTTLIALRRLASTTPAVRAMDDGE